jgi:uncharacterized protein (TIGR03084 family)
MDQADDFEAECAALHALLAPLTDAGFARQTQFKSWTINHVLQHLHSTDLAAALSLTDVEALQARFAASRAATAAGEETNTYTDRLLDGLSGQALLARWHEGYVSLAASFGKIDPKTRLKWAGPDMSARSSITARLMETWSHAQAIYDLLQVERVEANRVQNVVVMGNNTFGWTFVNRGEDTPEPRPFLKLTAPSGAIWEYNEPQEDNRIEGAAVAFCQVVTQTRNIADTPLKVTGEVAARWMAVAQCFAGPPRTPPAPGTRFKLG